ncbi:MAG TPA: hypothetical protein VIN38_07710 [Thiobacillus sp.]
MCQVNAWAKLVRQDIAAYLMTFLPLFAPSGSPLHRVILQLADIRQGMATPQHQPRHHFSLFGAEHTVVCSLSSTEWQKQNLIPKLLRAMFDNARNTPTFAFTVA